MPAPLVYSYIRFSTPQQALGDSKRRQTAMAEEWAAAHSMALDSSLSLTDLGVSAFRGSNVTEGALAGFLALVKGGKVPSGSVLVVESLDRISRDEITEAFPIFMSIIKAGITVVTLGDKREYTKESVNKNPMELMMSIMVMSRAHEESLTKSKRLSAAWEHKRKNADAEKLSRIAPTWLNLNNERTGFDLIPERVAVVRRIYKMCIDGYGAHTITKTLNQEKVPTFNKGQGWHLSTVKKILNNRSVMGEFQPHKMVNGKREPIGDVHPDYFPEIIKESTF